MNIEKLIKSENLSAKDAAKVRKVLAFGSDVVDVNVNDFLHNKMKRCVYPLRYPQSYTFKIENTKGINKIFKAKHKFVYGVCSYVEKVIVLNIDHVIHSSIADIVDTLLHECAHAVAYHGYGDNGHGKKWRMVSNMFGSHPRATSKIASDSLEAKIAEEKCKYRIVYMNVADKKVELAGMCCRKLKNMDNRYMWHRKDETHGKLWLVKNEDYNKYGLDYDKLVNVIIR